MDRWADFVILCITHDDATGTILSVGAVPDLGDLFGPRATWTREVVVKALERGFTFCTAPRSPDGKLTRGARVEIALVHGEKFLRTDKNAVKSDNLGSLPAC